VFSVKYEQGVYISEDGILHIRCRENLKSYKKRELVRISFTEVNLAVPYFIFFLLNIIFFLIFQTTILKP
jgi:hypothetical protein